MLNSSDDRIRFSQAVDYLDQGRADLVGEDRLQHYIDAGLLTREDGAIKLTPQGLREHEQAKQERSTDG